MIQRIFYKRGNLTLSSSSGIILGAKRKTLLLHANCFAPFLRIDVGGDNENMSASSAFAAAAVNEEDRHGPLFCLIFVAF